MDDEHVKGSTTCYTTIHLFNTYQTHTRATHCSYKDKIHSLFPQGIDRASREGTWLIRIEDPLMIEKTLTWFLSETKKGQ